MNYESVKNNENIPVKLLLKDNITFYYGTYKIQDRNTISFTDRKRQTFPIEISLIGLIQPVDRIKYIDDNSNRGEQ